MDDEEDNTDGNDNNLLPITHATSSPALVTNTEIFNLHYNAWVHGHEDNDSKDEERNTESDDRRGENECDGNKNDNRNDHGNDIKQEDENSVVPQGEPTKGVNLVNYD